MVTTAWLMAAALVVWRLTANGDDTEPRPATGPASAPARQLVSRQLGVELRHPADWRRTREGRTIRLLGPGRTVAVSVSAVTGSGQRGRVEASVRRELLRTYEGARVAGRSRARVAGRSGRVLEVTGRNRRDEPVRALVAVVSTRWRTYALQVVSSTRPAAPRLIEARAILASARFFEPA